jgi:hypothetical protein
LQKRIELINLWVHDLPATPFMGHLANEWYLVKDIIPTPTHGWLFSIFDSKFTHVNKEGKVGETFVLSSSFLNEFFSSLSIRDRSLHYLCAGIYMPPSSFYQVFALAP